MRSPSRGSFPSWTLWLTRSGCASCSPHWSERRPFPGQMLQPLRMAIVVKSLRKADQTTSDQSNEFGIFNSLCSPGSSSDSKDATSLPGQSALLITFTQCHIHTRSQRWQFFPDFIVLSPQLRFTVNCPLQAMEALDMP